MAYTDWRDLMVLKCQTNPSGINPYTVLALWKYDLFGDSSLLQYINLYEPEYTEMLPR